MEDIWEGTEDDFQYPSFLPTQPCPLHSPQATRMTENFPNILCDLLPWFLLLFSLHSPDSYPSSKMQVRCSLLQEAFLDHLPIPIRGPLGSFSPVASAFFSPDHPELSLPIFESSPMCNSPPPPTLTVTHLGVPMCPTQGHV